MAGPIYIPPNPMIHQVDGIPVYNSAGYPTYGSCPCKIFDWADRANWVATVTYTLECYIDPVNEVWPNPSHKRISGSFSAVCVHDGSGFAQYDNSADTDNTLDTAGADNETPRVQVELFSDPFCDMEVYVNTRRCYSEAETWGTCGSYYYPWLYSSAVAVSVGPGRFDTGQDYDAQFPTYPTTQNCHFTALSVVWS